MRLPTHRDRWPGPEYLTRVTVRAPRNYVYSWCTDFAPEDSRLEKSDFSRRLIERSPRRVVFEDLQDTPDGWFLSRHVVSLDPPSRWHMVGVGFRSQVIADYRLREASHGTTQLELRWRRRASLMRFVPSPKKQANREATTMWRRFARALQKDVRTGKPAAPRRRASPR